MSMIYFSADLHLGHANIIRYTNRPFKSLEEMDETIINNFNARIKPEDTVFHVGDFCFRNSPGGKEGEGTTTRAKEYIKRLNCGLVFIVGNHDSSNSLKTPIESIVLRYGGMRIKLVHDPKYADSSFELNLCGHVHDAWKVKKLSDKSYIYNVGVDVNKFMPITFDEIMREINIWKRNNEANKNKNTANASGKILIQTNKTI